MCCAWERYRYTVATTAIRFMVLTRDFGIRGPGSGIRSGLIRRSPLILCSSVFFCGPLFFCGLRSPERRRLRRLIPNREMRRVVARLLPVEALDPSGRQPRGQQCPLWWIRFLPRQVHLLEVVHERTEEVREAGSRRWHRQIHLG